MNKTKKARTKRPLGLGLLLLVVLAAAMPVAARAADNPLQLTVRQTFEAAPAPADSTFTYRLSALEAGSPMPEGSTAQGHTFTIAGTADKAIGPIGFTRAGVYRYELRCVSEQRPGYVCDGRIYSIEAYVDEALRVDIIVWNADHTKAGALEFRHDYKSIATDPALMADPPVRKTVSGSPGRSSTFTFKLEARNPSNPMPAGSVGGVKLLQIVGQGEGEFGRWSYDRAGTYYYTVSEVDTREAGYTYDKAVYTITDTVTEKDGRLVLARVVTNAQNKPVTALDYINKYNKDGPKTGDEMNKTLYIAIFAAGGALAVGAVVFLIASRRRKGAK